MRRYLALVLLLAACEDPICSAGTEYDRGEKRCVCREPRIWSGEACLVPDAAFGDAAIDPPTAPVVEIAPVAPRTLDDLTARITTDGVDPRGETLTYQYRWLRDDVVSEVETETVSAELTTKHERWTVEVTAVAADGRRSAPATASVTIANSPPHLGTVGLSDYRPVAGDALEAFTGRVIDDDGDAVSLVFEWRGEGDVLLDGTSGARLVLEAERFPAGTAVRAIATPNDGEADGAAVTSGVAEVRADVTRWRALTPDLYFDGARVVEYDAGHERFLLYGRADPDDAGTPSLWEITFDGERPRFVQLRPTGEGPTVRASAVAYDSSNRRILVFGGQTTGGERALTNAVWALDVRERGRERWSRVVVAGDDEAPPATMLASAIYDAERSALVVVGGAIGGADLSSGVWALDTSDPDIGVWRHLGELPVPLMRPALAIDARRDRLLVSGGIEGSLASSSASAKIRTLDLETAGAPVVDAGATLPIAVVHPFAFVDAHADRLLLFGGAMGAALDLPSELITVDLSDLSSTRIATTGAAPVGGAGAMTVEANGSMLVWPRQLSADGIDTLRFHRFDPEHQVWTEVFAPGVHAPGLTEAALTASPPQLFGGRTALGASVADDVWRLDSVLGWVRRPIGVDLVTSRRPPPRSGAARGEASRLWIVGGRLADGSPASTSVWSYVSGSPQWTEHTLAAGSPVPAGRSEAVLLAGCDGRLVGLFGGTPAADGWVLECTSGERECRWVAGSSSGAPSARTLAAAVAVERRTLLFGGLTSSGASDELFSAGTCGAAPLEWTSLTPTGTPPSPRFGHSMTSIGFPEARVLVLGGGATQTSPGYDVHELTGSGGTWRWARVVVHDELTEHPTGRFDHAAFWDDTNRRLIVHGGTRGPRVLSDTWELRLR